MKTAGWRWLLWLLPLAFCYWLHQYALRSWFWADDFAWLTLHDEFHDRASFLKTMFEPLAQGTIRPWSERGFFILFFNLFGLDALPYHLFVMATQFANICLLCWIVIKVGGSRIAAVVAPALWVANGCLVIPLGWASAYNQILCAFFLLLAFALYLSGNYWLQFAVFVLGFGALEINIVYPLILFAWLLLNRKDWRPALPLFAVSVAYYLLHRHFAPPIPTGPYSLHFDLSVMPTLYRYWKDLLIPPYWYSVPGHAKWFGFISGVVLTVATIALAWRSGRVAWFFLAWFLITLAPVLPLRDHITQYYLAVPALGVAVVLALALPAKLDRASLLFAVPLIWYLSIQIPTTRVASHWNFERSREVKTLVLGVVRAHELHPKSTILLANTTPYLYAFGIAHAPFHAAGFDQVYLTPETNFATYSWLYPTSTFTLPPGPTLNGLKYEEIEVYELAGERIRNITASYRPWAIEKLANTLPSRVDIGVPAMTYLLGSTWYPLEGSHRWMPNAATLRIAAPQSSEQKLIVTGYCPQDQTRLGPLKAHISIDGKIVSDLEFIKPEVPFTRIVSVPPVLTGKAGMEVGIAVDRTFQGGPHDRPLGLAFGVFELR